MDSSQWFGIRWFSWDRVVCGIACSSWCHGRGCDENEVGCDMTWCDPWIYSTVLTIWGKQQAIPHDLSHCSWKLAMWPSKSGVILVEKFDALWSDRRIVGKMYSLLDWRAAAWQNPCQDAQYRGFNKQDKNHFNNYTRRGFFGDIDGPENILLFWGLWTTCCGGFNTANSCNSATIFVLLFCI